MIVTHDKEKAYAEAITAAVVLVAFVGVIALVIAVIAS